MFIPDRILILLAAQPSMTRSAIRAALSDCKRVAVNGAIARLEDKGMIEGLGWGRYRLAATAVIPHMARQKSLRETLHRVQRG